MMWERRGNQTDKDEIDCMIGSQELYIQPSPIQKDLQEEYQGLMIISSDQSDSNSDI